MPVYVEKSLHKCQHLQPKQPQHVLHDWTISDYGYKLKYDKTKPDIPTLDQSGTQQVQSITRIFLYYLLAVDPTMLPALNKIYTQQSKPTFHNIKICNRVLGYEKK